LLAPISVAANHTVGRRGREDLSGRLMAARFGDVFNGASSGQGENWIFHAVR